MLTAAGFTSSQQADAEVPVPQRQPGRRRRCSLNVQSQLNALGNVNVVGVPTNQSDFYGKYLYVTAAPTPAAEGRLGHRRSPAGARTGTGTAAVTCFNPLFSSPGGFPPNGGSNFGYFTDPTVNACIKQALAQTDRGPADTYWAKADQAVMTAAAFYPITDDAGARRARLVRAQRGVHPEYAAVRRRQRLAEQRRSSCPAEPPLTRAVSAAITWARSCSARGVARRARNNDALRGELNWLCLKLKT